jgi:hypothetical protein
MLQDDSIHNRGTLAEPRLQSLLAQVNVNAALRGVEIIARVIYSLLIRPLTCNYDYSKHNKVLDLTDLLQ